MNGFLASGGGVIPSPSVLEPAITAKQVYILSAVYITIYAGLFLYVYVQLWMIWWYRYRRASYQSFFLFLCLIFSALRIWLFSSFFTPNPGFLFNNLWFFHWILYGLPDVILYLMVCLLFVFFMMIYLKYVRDSIQPNYALYKYIVRIVVVLSVTIFAVMSAVAVYLEYPYLVRSSPSTTSPTYKFAVAKCVVQAAFFILIVGGLCILMYKIAKLPTSANLSLIEGLTPKKTIIFTSIIISLFCTRVIYNTISVVTRGQIFGAETNWITVSDQVDFYGLSKGYAYISFGVFLFLWEWIPTMALTIMFRVPIRRSEDAWLTCPVGEPNPSDPLINTTSVATNYDRSFFFTNSHRYDSDESTWTSTRTSGGSAVPHQHGLMYGTGSPGDAMLQRPGSLTRCGLGDTSDRHNRPRLSFYPNSRRRSLPPTMEVPTDNIF